MPGHDVHLFVDRLIFGGEFKEVHEAIDHPVKYFGRGHRKWFHTTTEAVYIAAQIHPGISDAMVAASIHIWLDYECTNDKSFKRLMKSEAKKDKKWRKNPLKIFQRKITRQDLLMGYLTCPERDNLTASRRSCVKRKKRKKNEKKDEFWEWYKLYKSLR